MPEPKRIVIIGGSAAGAKAASKARRLDAKADITIIQRDRELSMAACGYPYYVGGVFEDRNQLISTPAGVVRDPAFFMNIKGIRAFVQMEAETIDREAHEVYATDLNTGDRHSFPYDKLIIATGASPFRPPIPGIELEGVTTLHSLHDADYLRHAVVHGDGKRAVVLGGGLIGIESCEALRLAGFQVTIVEMLPQLLAFLDWEMAKLVQNYIISQGVDVITEDSLTAFLEEGNRLAGVQLKSGRRIPCDLAVVSVGVRPNSRLAASAGLAVGARGGITVDAFMQTTDPDIYAVGDCTEIPNILTGQRSTAFFGDLANLQGRVAAQNVILGNHATFPGTIQTGVCKIMDYAAGATGLSEANARKAGFENIITVIQAGSDKPHFMQGKSLFIKLVADAATGRLLGMQCLGPGDVSKRVAEAAMAIQGKLTVSDLVNADLPYAPPFSPALDNLIVAAHCLENKMLGRMKGISSIEVKHKIDTGENPFLLDVRGPDEFETTRLGLGETLIPLGALRNRLEEIPADRAKEIICYCAVSLRGYEAAAFLEGMGWTNVKVMEGGVAAWPFPRER